MGRFDGVLLVSDFDNTLVYTCEAFANNEPAPPIPQRNLDAIRRFVEEGGRFAVATGRGAVAVEPFIHAIPTNAPAVVSNGGGIYDFATGRYLVNSCLPQEAMAELDEVLAPLPHIAAEIYHMSTRLEAFRPNRWTENHAKLAKVTYEEIPSMSAAAPQVTKVVLVADAPAPVLLRQTLVERGALERYELVNSNESLLEVTAKGADKGNAIRELARLCGVEPAHICCVGDHANDLSMLRVAARAFAPANAIDEVKEEPGVTVVGHCRDGAVADVIALLAELYPEV